MMMSWPEIFDRQLGNHHLHQGLSHGWLIVIWLAYILSEGDHCKSHVQEWARQRRQALEKLTGQTIRPEVEFNDDRLSIVLRRLSDSDAWASQKRSRERRPKRLGERWWSNAPVEQLSLEEAVISYREGVCLERDFHLVKDRPLGLRSALGLA